jgi:hypothetical protein
MRPRDAQGYLDAGARRQAPHMPSKPFLLFPQLSVSAAVVAPPPPSARHPALLSQSYLGRGDRLGTMPLCSRLIASPGEGRQPPAPSD